MFAAPALVAEGDRDGDQKLSRGEWADLANRWFDRMDSKGSGQVNQEQLVASLGELMPMPGGPGGGPEGGGPGGSGFGPAMFLGPGIFAALDADQDGFLGRSELKDRFATWYTEWDADQTGALDVASIGQGVSAVLPQPQFGGPGEAGGVAGPGEQRRGGGPREGDRRIGGGGFGGPGGGGGVDLDPLVGAEDPSKPLRSRLLALPSLRARYLAYVRDIAETWLDWDRLGPRVADYRMLIASDSSEVMTQDRPIAVRSPTEPVSRVPWGGGAIPRFAGQIQPGHGSGQEAEPVGDTQSSVRALIFITTLPL